MTKFSETPNRRPAPQQREAPRMIDNPEPGFFKVRLLKDGPWVAARIEYGPTKDPETGEPLDRSPMWTATIDGKPLADSPSPDPLKAGVFRIWHSGRRIEEEDYLLLLRHAEWAKQHSPNDPAANPTQRIDLMRAPLP
jgi:hypothetical protein